jgi:hypothetical protein
MIENATAEWLLGYTAGVLLQSSTLIIQIRYTVCMCRLHVTTEVDCGIFMLCVEAGGEQLLITQDTR